MVHGCLPAGERTVWLPEGLQGGDLLEVCDTWVDKSHPAALMASAAFTQVREGRGGEQRCCRLGVGECVWGWVGWVGGSAGAAAYQSGSLGSQR